MEVQSSSNSSSNGNLVPEEIGITELELAERDGENDLVAGVYESTMYCRNLLAASQAFAKFLYLVWLTRSRVHPGLTFQHTCDSNDHIPSQHSSESIFASGLVTYTSHCTLQ